MGSKEKVSDFLLKARSCGLCGSGVWVTGSGTGIVAVLHNMEDVRTSSRAFRGAICGDEVQLNHNVTTRSSRI